MDALPDDLKWAAYRCTVPGGGKTLADAMKIGSSVAVSDASLKSCFGTAAFVIEGPTDIHRAVGVNIVPGPVKDGDSYRCELSGLIGAMTVVRTICQSHNVSSGGMQVACDNISTLRIFKPDFVPEPTQESFDLVCSLWQLVQTIPIRLEAVHV